MMMATSTTLTTWTMLESSKTWTSRWYRISAAGREGMLVSIYTRGNWWTFINNITRIAKGHSMLHTYFESTFCNFRSKDKRLTYILSYDLQCRFWEKAHLINNLFKIYTILYNIHVYHTILTKSAFSLNWHRVEGCRITLDYKLDQGPEDAASVWRPTRWDNDLVKVTGTQWMQLAQDQSGWQTAGQACSSATSTSLHL